MIWTNSQKTGAELSSMTAYLQSTATTTSTCIATTSWAVQSMQDGAGLHDHDGEEGHPPTDAHQQVQNKTLNWSQGASDQEQLLENMGIDKAVSQSRREQTKQIRTERM